MTLNRRTAPLIRILALASALVTLAALTACQVGPAAPSGQGDTPQTSFGVLRAPTGALAVVAGDKGWFSDAGVDVEFKSFAEGGGPAIVQAMGGGTPDIALLNAATVVQAIGQGSLDVQIVSVASNPAKALPLLSTSKVTSVEDLKGKRVSAPKGGGQYYLLASILAKHNMTFKDIDYKPLPVGEAQAAFLTGRLDAVISSANGTVLIKKNAPDTKVLFDGTQFDPADAYSSPDVIIATRKAIKEKPEAIKHFLQAYHGNGVGYLTDPSTKADCITDIQDYMTSVGAGVDDVESTKATVEAIEFYNLADAKSRLRGQEFMDSLDKQVDFWTKAGVIEDAPDIKNAVNTDMIE